MPQVKPIEPEPSNLVRHLWWCIPLSLGIWVVTLWSISVAFSILWGVLV